MHRMRPSMDHYALRQRSSATLAQWVVLCLLFAQWLGFAHAISHAGTKPEIASHQRFTADNTFFVFDHQKASSSCAALDAVTLGASLHSTPMLALLLTLSPTCIQSAAFNAWQQSFTALFSSRAPPPFH
ncbi:MAG: hypothetical protein ACKOAO_00265 [Oxalobacteraceae bacterium]